jgi:hypothetical protein
MKIYFTAEGGFGFFSQLNKPLEINTEDLPEEEAMHLENLINKTSFFSLPSGRQKQAKGADIKKYTIAVENNGKKHEVNVTDLEANANIQNLLNYLRKQQKGRR